MGRGGTIECSDCSGAGERPTFDEDGLHDGKEPCATCAGEGTLTPEQYRDVLNAERHRLLDAFEAGEIDGLWREEFGP